MDFPEATNHLYDLRSGLSRPQVFECSDGIDRVVKIPGLCDPSSLASDWMGSLLAVSLDVLVPAPSIVTVTPAAIRTLPIAFASEARQGLAFGNSYIRRAANVLGLESLLASVNSVQLLSRLVPLDTWIQTEDRMTPEFGRNLLIDQGGLRSNLVAIDFGMCFSEVLRVIFGGSRQIRLVMHQSLASVLDDAEIDVTLRRIESIPERDLAVLVHSTPPDWLDDERKSKVISYLLRTRQEVRTAVYSGLEALRW